MKHLEYSAIIIALILAIAVITVAYIVVHHDAEKTNVLKQINQKLEAK